MAKPCTNESPCLQSDAGGAHSVVCRKLVTQGARPRTVARPQPRPARAEAKLLERAGVTPAGPGDEPVVARATNPFEAAAAPLLTGRIGCGCGEVGDLGSREATVTRGGKVHRYGAPCFELEKPVREGDQPLPIDGVGEGMHQRVARRLLERGEQGFKRYGKRLQLFNGRNALQDLIEELLDGVAYAEQVEGELHAIREALLVLAQAVRGYRVPNSGLLTRRDAVEAALALAAKLEGAVR